MESRMDFDTYFIMLADMVSLKSKDPSTKVGSVIVGPDNQLLTSGYNGHPRGIDESNPHRWERPTKYALIVHSEVNAISNAARYGIPLQGCRMYLNWSPIPCQECTKSIIQAGITEIVGPNRPFGGRGAQWTASLQVAKSMLREAGVAMRTVEVPTSLLPSQALALPDESEKVGRPFE